MVALKCAVVIPTKNAMPRIRQVVKKVLDQSTAWPFELLVIDSGSTDGTVEFLQTHEQVTLVSIKPEEFGHGKTRNQAIGLVDAEFVAFLTHDAEPYDENWLSSLVRLAESDGRIAGVFGRHVAYETASPFVKRDLDEHFLSFAKQPCVVDRHLEPEKYANDMQWRQFLHFYSDNNSLIRKSIWQQHPYPDVEFAEDQLWARAIIEAGYKKAYSHDAVVYHSHDYRVMEQLKRAFDESRNFKKYFGYELSKNPLAALRSVFRMVFQALGQEIDTVKYGNVTATQRAHRAAQRAALVIGHFLGSRHDRLPRRWADRLSLDNKLFRT